MHEEYEKALYDQIKKRIDDHTQKDLEAITKGTEERNKWLDELKKPETTDKK